VEVKPSQLDFTWEDRVIEKVWSLQQARSAGPQLYRSYLLLSALLFVTTSAFAQGDSGTPQAPDRSKPMCGAGQPGAPAPTLDHEVSCTAYDIVHKKQAGNPDASLFTEKSDELTLLALAEGLTRQAKAKASEIKLSLITTQHETARTDKQIGAPSASQGSTTLAEKPNYVDLLGLAIENGAIQKEVSGSTLTLSSSLYALTTLSHGDTAANYQQHEDLTRVGGSATFNISNQDNILANATRRQLAEWAINIRLTPDRTTRSAQFYEFWRQNVEPKINAEAVVITQAQASIFRNETELLRREIEDKFFNTHITADRPHIGTGYVQGYLTQHPGLSDDQLVVGLTDDILTHLKVEVSDRVDSFGLDPTTKARIVTVVMPALTQAHLQAEEALKSVDQEINALDGKAVASFRYTNVRDTAAGTYSVLKLLVEKHTSDAMKLDFNLAGSLYSSPRPTLNQQTVRDVATALSWEARLGKSPFVLQDEDQSQVTFSFSGRYQRLLENRHVAGKKADIASAEAKLTVPLFSGLTLPLSFTYSNATELSKKDHLRFNFGFNFDSDKLYRLLQFKKLRQSSAP
jgi:hypothetical protein